MSKIIRMTPEMIEEAKQRFESRLKNMNCTDGKVTYTDTFVATGDKATIWFTPDAYTKMIALIQEMDKEVAWHGTAHRIDDVEGNNYLISDILVYPQTVTGSTVDTDQEEYEKWMMALDDDTYNSLRFQGHSHVRMHTSPSPTDLEHQYKIVQQLEKDMFYIFMIWNKDFKYTAKIYDMKINTLFEPGDISVGMIGASYTLTSFMAEAKSMVKPKVYNYQKTSGAYNGTGTAPAAKAPASTTSAQPVKGEEKKELESVPSRPKPCIGNGWSGAANHQNNAANSQDDYDDRYGDDYYYGHYPQHYYN